MIFSLFRRSGKNEVESHHVTLGTRYQEFEVVRHPPDNFVSNDPRVGSQNLSHPVLKRKDSLRVHDDD